MMRLESKRLILYPVGDRELRALIGEEKDPDLKQAYTEMLRGCTDDPDGRIWYTVWFMELKDSPGTIVGDFSFKGRSNNGMVELGYGLRAGFCGHGYMTEAVRAAVEWALSQKGVTSVEAETDAGNTASQRVLLRAGFTATGTVGAEGPRFVRTMNNRRKRHDP